MSEVLRLQRKPEYVEVMQFTGDNGDDLIKFGDGKIVREWSWPMGDNDFPRFVSHKKREGAEMRYAVYNSRSAAQHGGALFDAVPGTWFLKHLNGTCKGFLSTYTSLADIEHSFEKPAPAERGEGE